jgi:predicted dehydrogenase
MPSSARQTGRAPTIRVGLLGAGAMGAEHAFCYGQMTGVELAGVFSRSRDRAAAVAAPFGCVATDDPAMLIENPSIGAIDVCLPTPVHAGFVLAALAAGKHVFCETPLTLDLDEGRRMRAAARGADKLLQVGLLMRSISTCGLVKAAVDSGEHGPLLSVTTHRLGSYLRPDAPDHKAHYSDPTTELMTFDLDFINWVMGRPCSVVARSAGQGGEVSALLAFEDDRTATVLASGVMPAAFPFTTGFRAVFADATIATETTIADGAFNSWVKLFRGTEALTPDTRHDNPYQIELERFIACMAGGADPALLDVDRALEALSLSRAVQESITAGAVMHLDDAVSSNPAA